MSRVLRVSCLDGLLGAQVHGDGDDRQDADVPESGQRGRFNKLLSVNMLSLLFDTFCFRVNKKNNCD